MEYAMLSVHPLQSTSDQQDPTLYAAIAAAVPTAVTPEQSATWAYPQPGWDDETNALTVVNSLLGRIHLSGHLDELNPEQFRLICEGMEVYKSIRQALRHARPIWPLGLPQWHDKWICLGMVARSGDLYLAVWRRGGSREMDVPLSNFGKNRSVTLKLLYPSRFETEYTWNADDSTVKLKLPDQVCARLLQISCV